MHASFCLHEIAYMMTQISRMRMYFAKGARPEDTGYSSNVIGFSRT